MKTIIKIIYKWILSLVHFLRILLRVTTEYNDGDSQNRDHCHRGGRNNDK